MKQELEFTKYLKDAINEEDDDLIVIDRKDIETKRLKISITDKKEIPNNAENMFDKDFYLNATKRTKEAERRIEEARLKKLDRIDFSFLRIDKIPDSLWNLKNVKSLDLSGNLLKDLPPEIENFQKLEALFLWKNCFSEFPKSILKLKNLRELSLAENHLVFIPDEIYLLHNLETLFLNSNTLIEIPYEIIELKHLQSITLHNNRLEVPPQQLVDWNNIKVLKNFFLNPSTFFPLDYYYAKIRAFLVKFRSLYSQKEVPYDEIYNIVGIINDAIDDIFPKVEKLLNSLIKKENSPVTFERMDIRLCCLLSLNLSYLTSKEIAIILLGYENLSIIMDENEISKLTFRVNTRKSRLKKDKLETLLNEKDLDIDEFCRNIENNVKERINGINGMAN